MTIRILDGMDEPNSDLLQQLMSIGACPVSDIIEQTADGPVRASQWFVRRKPIPFLLKLYGSGESLGDVIGRLAAMQHAAPMYDDDPPAGLMFVASVRLNNRMPGSMISLVLAPVTKSEIDAFRLAWLRCTWFDGVQHLRALRAYLDHTGTNEPTGKKRPNLDG